MRPQRQCLAKRFKYDSVLTFATDDAGADTHADAHTLWSDALHGAHEARAFG